jgi:hypothetical protein
MKRVVFIALGIMAAVILLLIVQRSFGRVLAHKQSSTGEGSITVRQLQHSPGSIVGLLGIGDSIYRCEYALHPGWPISASISLNSASYHPSKIVIEWSDIDSAKVEFDEQIRFYLSKGVWQIKEPEH